MELHFGRLNVDTLTVRAGGPETSQSISEMGKKNKKKGKKEDPYKGNYSAADGVGHEEEYVEGWNNDDAAKYGIVLSKAFGPPKIMVNDMLAWDAREGFAKVWVLDESIPHDFPVDHMDFVYSCRNIKVPPELVGQLAMVSGSIIVDGLKGEVTARCGMLIKNAVTLGFVEDVVEGEMNNRELKAEYARRIKGNITPEWYKDTLKEGT